MGVRKNIFYTGIVVASFGTLFTACKGSKADAPKGGKPNGMSAIGHVVTPGSFSDMYTATGSLLPNEEVTILPEIAGRVTAINFKEGTAVSQGQLLVQLYDQEIRAQLQKLKALRELQVKTQNRQQSLVDIGGISKQDFETTQTQLLSVDADIALAEAQLRATKIIAPFSGNIGIRNISVGAVVTPTTVITTLQQTSSLKIDFTVPDQYRKAITNGKDVLFSINGVRDTLTGTVIAIDPGADAITRAIRVRATVPNPGNKLTAGSFARVLIPLQSDTSAILIPSQSVIPTTKDKLVAVIRNGKAELTKVILGTRTSGKIEVLNGLQAGDTILTTGIMQVKQGMDVKVTKVQ